MGYFEEPSKPKNIMSYNWININTRNDCKEYTTYETNDDKFTKLLLPQKTTQRKNLNKTYYINLYQNKSNNCLIIFVSCMWFCFAAINFLLFFELINPLTKINEKSKKDCVIYIWAMVDIFFINMHTLISLKYTICYIQKKNFIFSFTAQFILSLSLAWLILGSYWVEPFNNLIIPELCDTALYNNACFVIVVKWVLLILYLMQSSIKYYNFNFLFCIWFNKITKKIFYNKKKITQKTKIMKLKPLKIIKILMIRSHCRPLRIIVLRRHRN